MDSITVLQQSSGRPIRPLNGVNGGPVTHNFQRDASKLFTDANIPYCRLHDIEGTLGGGKFVDVRNIFPLWELDENDPVRVMGRPDDLKLCSCMTLFASIAEPDSVFDKVLDKYYGGKRDAATLRML